MSSPINYDPNTPINSQSFAAWQESFIENFTQLSDAFSANHVALDAASNNGNHTVIQLLEQASAQQTGISEITVYTKNVLNTAGEKTNQDQLFMRLPGNSTEFQFSCYQIYKLTQPNTFFTFLPGGLIVYFGLYLYNIAAKQQILNLFPAVAKNIMSVNFTSTQQVIGSGISFSQILNPSGITTGLRLATIYNQYYVVLANVI